jgi:hypothetical protein
MGTFKHKVLGEVAGKVGSVIGRRRKNKYFIYAAPTEVKISNSPAAIRSRNIMIPLAKFASVVNKIPELKYLWLSQKIDTFDVFHKIEKENYKYVIPERPTINNIITPLYSVKNPITEGSISSAGIKLKIDIDKELLLQFGEAEEILGVGVICFYEPVENGIEFFRMSRLDTIAFDVPNEGDFEIEIVFNEEEQKNYNSYQKSILYFTLVSKDSNGIPVTCTINYRKEFVHEIVLVKESAGEGSKTILEKTLMKESINNRDETISERYSVWKDLPYRDPQLMLFE